MRIRFGNEVRYLSDKFQTVQISDFLLLKSVYIEFKKRSANVHRPGISVYTHAYKSIFKGFMASCSKLGTDIVFSERITVKIHNEKSFDDEKLFKNEFQLKKKPVLKQFTLKLEEIGSKIN